VEVWLAGECVCVKLAGAMQVIFLVRLSRGCERFAQQLAQKLHPYATLDR